MQVAVSYVAELRDVFNNFDQDRSGAITLVNVSNMIERSGYIPRYDKLTEMFQQADLDGEHLITQPMLLKIMLMALCDISSNTCL